MKTFSPNLFFESLQCDTLMKTKINCLSLIWFQFFFISKKSFEIEMTYYLCYDMFFYDKREIYDMQYFNILIRDVKEHCTRQSLGYTDHRTKNL